MPWLPAAMLPDHPLLYFASFALGQGRLREVDDVERLELHGAIWMPFVPAPANVSAKVEEPILRGWHDKCR